MRSVEALSVLAVAFPITSGDVDPKLADGALINHSGGLSFSAGKTKVALKNFRIRVTSSQATISAAIGTSRATIINLDTSKAKVTRPGLNLRLANVGVKLSATGAEPTSPVSVMQRGQGGTS